MKFNALRIAAAAALLLSAAPSFAEGYQINTLSARQNGMGHTGTSLKLGAESQIFNPAAMAYMENNIDFSGSVSCLFSHADADVAGKEYQTDNNPATPMSFSLGMKVYKNFAAGVTFYTPYGSGINWGENWPGSMLNQKVKLRMYTVQPTLSWRILPNLSVGAGAMVTWGTVDLNKGLIPAESINGVLQLMDNPYRFTDTPASVKLNGKAATTVGIHVGAMWDVTKRLTLGVDFRSKMTLKVKKGDASVSYANEIAKQLLEERLNMLNQANFTASMPAAATLTFGASYRPTDRLLLAAEAQWTGWSAYKTLEIDFLSEALSAYNQHLEKNYRNSWTFHLGGQYSLTERLDLRLGMMIDTTPVNIDYYNPETPGMTKIEPSCGFSFRPVKNFSIDASLLYVAGLGRDNTRCPYTDLLSGQTKTFEANYKLHAWCPAIGCSLRF